jgi:hypothetical protein
MRSRFVKMSSIAILMAGLNLVPLNAAEDEVKGAVPTRADANNPNSEVYRASDVMNLPVKNKDGEEVGRIKDLVINGESREVLYAVVAMNEGKEKDALYVMPWTVFQPSYGQNAIQYAVLGLRQSVWLQAPFYSQAQWRQASFSQWGPRVNGYYANHIPTSTGSNSKSTAQTANKPAIGDGEAKGSTSEKSKADAPAKNDAKSAAKGDAGKPAVKGAESTPDKAATAPAEKEPKPVAPKKAPAPKEPKPSAPNPK